MNAIELNEVTVIYERQRLPSLKEWIVSGFRARAAIHGFSALRKIDIDIPQGQTVGIVGGNGAGKSTLLRSVAGIITPAAGEVVTRGTVAPLIELGTGFDIELSGRENIFFNGALLGRSRATMQDRLDEIIAFADLGTFIDQPLRTYSTGMVARLAFSIATAIDADIVMLDEILSVGDASFREKCETRIRRFYESGATVLFVSHDLASVERLCERVIWLDGGRIRRDGKAAEVILDYQQTTYIETHPEQFPDYVSTWKRDE